MKRASRKFHVGDKVRLLAVKSNHFRKGTLRKWTVELYTIKIIRRLANKNVYKIKDSKNRMIKGYFDDNELQLAREQDIYKIIILNQRKKGGVKEYLVHYDGFPSEDDTWIKENDIEDITVDE